MVGKSTWCFFVKGDERRWVYLDFDRWPPPIPDPLLRDLRLPAARALDGLVFSPTGRTKYHSRGPS